ncbi:MAG: xanthine dehydrogenase family protein subunit M [Sulfolobales archaeon]|nr:xanthine dehydrogenase family protein subunit M [Sulfolobales archaeon]MDW8082341.1 xanthine dehydrogenase family protein subunit M [Sulfolobales archaeon]
MLSINAFNTYRIPQIFDYYRPRDLREALKLLESVEGAKVVAGGTDLVVDLKYRRIEVRALIDISRLDELRFIKLEDSYVEIGSAVTIQEIVESSIAREKLPLLVEAAESLGSWQIRNLATIGGNLCTASPAADTAPPLLVYDAELELVSLRGVRTVPIEKFFTGPKRVVLERGEILRSIRIPVSRNVFGWSYIKLRRTSFDVAKASVAVLLDARDGYIVDARVALGSVAPTPVRARGVERSIVGLKIEEAARVASERVVNEISPIDDARSTAWYRLQASKTLVSDAVWRAYERLLKIGV